LELEFLHWLESLRQSAGEPYLWAINRISPYILRTFWEEGCEPTLEGVIRHCEYESLRLQDVEQDGFREPADARFHAREAEPGTRSPDLRKTGPSGSAFAVTPEEARCSGGSSLQMQPVLDGRASAHCLGHLERGDPA
jgi:hypothetical protein